jgi:hypothetical protein
MGRTSYPSIQYPTIEVVLKRRVAITRRPLALRDPNPDVLCIAGWLALTSVESVTQTPLADSLEKSATTAPKKPTATRRNITSRNQFLIFILKQAS